MTLEAIKQAIQHLPEDQRRELVDWLERLEETGWDEDLKRDFSPGGRGESLLNEIRRETSEGKASSLEEGLAKRRRSLS